ncbi:putative protein N(5)-glutamine methyltransferase [Agromyces sp. MMS24-JH15]|uniref:putative protein N(5)-glutamine methyltransferase n=1 Tax=Agromyces sp. MMS24-JH15 TaxID=3243765 RepID=UPI0037490D87
MSRPTAGGASDPAAGAADAATAAGASAVATLAARLRAAGSVFAEDEAGLILAEAAGDGEAVERMAARRAAGEPLEQVVGWAEFAGLRILVEPGVFVPRLRTEALVREALALLARARTRADPLAASDPTTPVVVDLCCGTGAIGAAIAAGLRDSGRSVELVAADLDPAAVRAARRNLEPLGALVVEGDLFDPLPVALRGRVDLIAANAPYVPTAAIETMPPEARDHEARIALDGGEQGVDVQRRVAAAALPWLRPGGHVLIETSRRQADATAALLEASGFAARIVRDDDVDGTVVIGTAGG